MLAGPARSRSHADAGTRVRTDAASRAVQSSVLARTGAACRTPVLAGRVCGHASPVAASSEPLLTSRVTTS